MDEPPSASDTARSTPDAGGGTPSRRGLFGVLIIFGGLAALFPAVLALTRGNWPEAIFTGGVGVALILGGLIWAGK